METDRQPFARIIEEELIDYRIRTRFSHPVFVKSLGLSGTERVLEFGSGGGCLSSALVRSLIPEGSLSCVEISPYWVEKARRRLKSFTNIKYLIGDITRMTIPKNHFDVVIIHFVLHDIEPAARIDVVSALAKCLRPEGILFISEPAKPEHGMPLSEIRALMRDTGLREIHTGCTRSWVRKWICYGKFKKSW
ncbi:MAG: class I SAM-dependent methyltransferase [Methanoregula sp.]|nr:class I SAM-dependent methyltransferase [Methanoregula sp.]